MTMPHRTRMQQPATTHCLHSQLKEHRRRLLGCQTLERMSGILSDVTVWREDVDRIESMARLLSEKAATCKKLTWGRDCQKLLTFAPKNFLPHSTSTTVRVWPHGKTQFVPGEGTTLSKFVR